MKIPHSGIIFSQNGIRQAEKEKKKILVLKFVHTRPGQESSERNSKKNSENYKTPFRRYFYPKRVEGDRERGKKKNLVPNSVHTRPGKENSQKNSRKIQKIIKPLPSIIFNQNGLRQTEKEKTKFQPRIPFTLNPGKKIQKKIVKKFRKL